jgi:hypothetical protein
MRALCATVLLPALVVACSAAPVSTPTGSRTTSAPKTPLASSSGSRSEEELGSLARPTDETFDGACEEDASCLGLLDAGEHTSAGFQPAVTFTVPRGWANVEDRQGIFALPWGAIPGDEIAIFGKPQATGNDGRIVTGADNSAAGLAAYLQARADLDVSATTTTIGGVTAHQLDIAIRPGAASTSRGCEVNVCITFASGRAKTWDYVLGLAGTERMRVYLVDAAGATMLIIADSLDGTSFAQITDAADPIVMSMRFH